jgi:hypothetical protein
MAELPSVITNESDTVPAIEACEAHLHHLARLNMAELVVTACRERVIAALRTSQASQAQSQRKEPTP